jgi:hypothetical protein
MTWRVAGSLNQLLTQINSLAPNRLKDIDGSIGDDRHCPGPSDHCAENCGGVVCARDFTHDPNRGADMGQILEALRISRDSRIKYGIFNWRMFSSYPTSTVPAWTWRTYHGSNGHATHGHLSVHCNTEKDSTRPWMIGGIDDMLTPEQEQLLKLIAQRLDAEGDAGGILRPVWNNGAHVMAVVELLRPQVTTLLVRTAAIEKALADLQTGSGATAKEIADEISRRLES